jgi:hypothetical protein
MSHPNDNENADSIIIYLLPLLVVGLIFGFVLPALMNSMVASMPISSSLNSSSELSAIQTSYVDSIRNTAELVKILAFTIPIFISIALLSKWIVGSGDNSSDEEESLAPNYTPATPTQPKVSLHSNVISDNSQESHTPTPTSQPPAQKPASLADHHQEDTRQLTRWDTLDLVSDSDE